MFGSFFTPMLIGAGMGLLNGGVKGAIKGGVTGGAGGAVSNLVPAANGLLPAKATAANVGNFLEPTMPQIGGANLYANGVVPPIPDPSVATPLMTSTPAAQGGMKLMPGEHKWMDGLSGLNIVPPNLGGQPQQQMPTAPGGGVNRGGQVSADAITQLIAGMKLPQKDKRLNLFWG